jgi:hypothetical protein
MGVPPEMEYCQSPVGEFHEASSTTFVGTFRSCATLCCLCMSIVTGAGSVRRREENELRSCGAVLGISFGILSFSAMVATTDAQAGMECPISLPANTPSSIKETKRQIESYSALMTAQGSRVVPEIVATLKKRHPYASNTEITNYLVTIYCPVIGKNAALGDERKTRKLKAFSTRVSRELAKR